MLDENQPPFRSPDTVHNEVSTNAGGVVAQTGSVFGDVHLHGGDRGCTDDDLHVASADLVRAIKAQWLREAEKRRIRDPLRLNVRFGPAHQEMTDYWGNVFGDPAVSEIEPPPLSGLVQDFTETYRGVPSGRMVVLGRGGAGKTVLVLQFALDLLKQWRIGGPVPVILSVGTWNPTTTSLRTWVEEQLARDYVGLGKIGRSRAPTASVLVAEGQILPIFDGFDEIAAQHRKQALRLLSECNLPMVLTSRTEEYAAAARELHVLSRAAAVELIDISPEDLRTYLPRTRRNNPGSASWEHVLDQLERQPLDPACNDLARVLSTPLMVALARDIYGEGTHLDPSVLLDQRRFSGTDALEHHLLDAFISELYTRPQETTGRRRRQAPRWDPALVQHWCAHLARRLDHHGTRDFVWWTLAREAPRRGSGVLLGLVGATVGHFLCTTDVQFPVRAVFGLVLAVGFSIWLHLGLAGGLPTGLVFGIAGGMALGWPAGLLAGQLGVVAGLVIDRRAGPPRPVVARLGLRRNLRRAAGGLTTVAATGVATGLVVGVLSGFTISAGAGMLGGVAVGVGTALAAFVNQPADTAQAVDPHSAFHADRSSVLLVGSFGGFLFGVSFGVAGDLSSGFIVLSGAGFTAVGVAALALGSAWGEFCLARSWFGLRGELPWRLLTFLHDAHDRGLLRQSGAAYQFRHARLQDRLASLCKK
ncbi:NACHT domain-containing protein [Lentzea sp. NEAU-D7]|uniref:NACHT domain-containing protein n=1 Tax=Lentzea sp. NEAU-D7 TaxID=2994667 RepID=UPI00224A792D|nr:NACHT domain-containing protein [Lentzea sp. NEAU-D7]MCX2951375.1 NACHT domain-containing protein [Lentzea sp. NEAU-D7]